MALKFGALALLLVRADVLRASSPHVPFMGILWQNSQYNELLSLIVIHFFISAVTDSSKPEQVETAAESLQDIPDYSALLVCAVILSVAAFRNLRFPFWT